MEKTEQSGLVRRRVTKLELAPCETKPVRLVSSHKTSSGGEFLASNLQNSNANHVETIKSRQSNNRYLFVSNTPRDFKATKAVNGATVLLSIFRHS